LRKPLAKILQFLINARRKYDGLGLSEEKLLPDEEKWTQQIIDEMAAQMDNHFHSARRCVRGHGCELRKIFGCSR
jgi:hypothetical protein